MGIVKMKVCGMHSGVIRSGIACSEMALIQRKNLVLQRGSGRAMTIRPSRTTRVYALFRRRSKQKKKETEASDPTILESPKVHLENESKKENKLDSKEEAKYQTTQEAQFESIPVTPLWRTDLTPKNIGATMFTGAFLAFSLYVIYLVFFKDRKEIMDRIECDLSSVMHHLHKIKQIRNESDLTDAEVLRVRSFLLSLIISSKKEDPIKTINTALRLIGSKHLSPSETSSLLEDTQMQSPLFSAETEPKTPVPEIEKIQKQTPIEASTPEPWWNRLPYICVLRLKKTGALFMANLGSQDSPKHAIVGFEDPEEGLIAGRIPAENQLWGKPSQMKEEGIHPMRPLEDERHFDLTWLAPKELQVLLNQIGCYTIVIPAGTLRTGVHGIPVASKEVLPRIIEISISEAYSFQGGKQISDLDDHVQTDDSKSEQITANRASSAKQEKPVIDMPPAQQEGIIGQATVNGVPPAKQEGIAEDLLFTEDPLAEQKGVNGEIPINGVPPAMEEDTVDQFTVNGVPPAEPEKVVDEISVNGDSEVESPVNGEIPFKPWWMKLPRLIVPKLKTANDEGGNVEINISLLPNEEDFRPVLFEDETDAKYFLGILGKLSGPKALVGIVSESPERFLKNNPGLESSKIVVLCKGALLLDREADKEGVKNAVRLAHTATELKKTGSGYSRGLDDSSLDGRVLKVAEEVVSNFQKRVKLNEKDNKKKGDEDYLDPIEGLLNDLDSGGLEAMFGHSQEPGKNKFGFGDDSEQNDELYRSFVDRMGAKIAEETNKIHPKIDPINPQDSSFSEVELEADLDALVDDLETDEHQQDDDFNVVYPAEVDGGVKRGSTWFLALEVVFMPQYLTVKGESTFLAISSADLDRRLLIGFQDQKEAEFCKELMKQWAEDDETIAAGVVPMHPESLLEYCKESDVDPVILRKSSLQLTLNMTRNEFFSSVCMIACTQSSDFTIFNR